VTAGSVARVSDLLSDLPAPALYQGVVGQDRVVEQLRRAARHPVHAYLLESAPRGVAGGELVLGVRHPFHLERLEDAKNRVIVGDALTRVLGGPFRLRFMLDETAETAAVSRAAGPGPNTAPALVDEAVRRFGNPVQEVRRLE